MAALSDKNSWGGLSESKLRAMSFPSTVSIAHGCGKALAACQNNNLLRIKQMNRALALISL